MYYCSQFEISKIHRRYHEPSSKKENFASKLQATGDLYGDMFEISNFRKEDIANITDPSGEFVEVLQCHNASKGPQSRGHQYAGAFLYKVFTLYNV